jgi:hypothetical protein
MLAYIIGGQHPPADDRDCCECGSPRGGAAVGRTDQVADRPTGVSVLVAPACSPKNWKAMPLPPTLAVLAVAPGELLASCQNRHHNAVLPVALVLAQYGPTIPFPEVKGRFRCSACGSRQVDVRPNWSKHSPGQITRHTDR